MIWRSLVILLQLFCKSVMPISNIKGPPRETQKNLQQLARLGDELKLSCPIEGNPPPFIEWIKDEETIDYQWTRYRSNKRSLKISQVDKSDSGRFVCKGINGFGKAEVKIDLIVIDPADFPGLEEGQLPQLIPPSFTTETINAKVSYDKKSGDTLRISCDAVGKPEPIIIWYKNSYELLENVRKKNGKSTLLVRNLLARDRGTYTCVAKNIVGEVSKDFDVKMKHTMNVNPDFFIPLMNKTIVEGETASFDCRVSSYIKPSIKWLKKLESLDFGQHNQSEVITVGDDNYKLIHNVHDITLQQHYDSNKYVSQLILSSVIKRDAGMYICFVTNPSGGFNYQPAYLTVISRKTILSGDSQLVMILVISFSVMLIFILTVITVCVLKKRKHESQGSGDGAEVRKNLMPPIPEPTVLSDGQKSCGMSLKSEQPLPTPPTQQWSSVYGQKCENLSDSGQFDGYNTYEIPPQHKYAGTTSDSSRGFVYGESKVGQIQFNDLCPQYHGKP